MSFGLSPSGIKLAWQLASFLHEKCFTKAQGADILYLRFGREIELFSGNLQQLEAVINDANRQRPARPWRDPDDECRVALQPVSQAVGDFRNTLDECEKLLNDHERFQRDPAGFVDNVVWHISTQRDVDILRERVHFHATKLLVILKPFEIHLLLEIRRELQNLRQDVSEIRKLLDNLLCSSPSSTPRTELWDIPEEINGKFLDSLRFNAPETFHDLSDIPLKEGFDALVFHFSQSTVQFNPGFDPSQRTPEETQYTNLLKSRWILEKLEYSSQLTAVGTAPLWASALNEIKSDIVHEFKRFEANELVPPPQDVIARLPDKCFSIWVIESPPLLPANLAEQRPLEAQEKRFMGHQQFTETGEIWDSHTTDVAIAELGSTFRCDPSQSSSEQALDEPKVFFSKYNV
ncbi:MAG: hypothetical protein Q9208_004255 [Pyrenodesmia sp. 3 TL-2023]